MIKLMKYEFRKTMAVKMMVLGLTALAEIVFLIGLWGDRIRMLQAGIVILTMLAFGSLMVIGLASVVVLHRDVNTRQSYMLFMTPNSCYKIMGAKMLENGLSIALAGVCFFALGALDVTLLFAKQNQLANLWEFIQNFLKNVSEELTFDLPTMLMLTLNLLGSWISSVTAMYLGVVISAALLNGKRFNGLVSFLLIVAILWFIGWVQVIATEHLGSIQTQFIVQAVIALAFSAVMYILASQIMERKLSV